MGAWDTKPGEQAKSMGLRHGTQRLERADQAFPSVPPMPPSGGLMAQEMQAKGAASGAAIIPPVLDQRARGG